MNQLGLKGLLLLSALAVASPAIVHAQATGGGNTGAGSSDDNSGGSTGSVGRGGNTGSAGAGTGPAGTSGGTGAGYDSPGAVSPNDDSPKNSPCPEGYALSTKDDNTCVKQ